MSEPPTSPGPHPPASLAYEPPVTAPPAPAPPGGDRRLPRPLLAVVALAVVLAAVLLVRLLTAPSQVSATRTGFVAPPTMTADTPTSLASFTPWAGTLAPSVSPTATAPGSPTAAPVTDDSFCNAARSDLASLGEHGLSALTALAGGAGDAAPQARAFVEGAVQRADELRRRAPAALKQAVETLDDGWSRLSAELARNGYDRAGLALFSLKLLTDPALGAAVDAVTRWSTTHCGGASASPAQP